MNAINFDSDKILKIAVTLGIITYLLITGLKSLNIDKTAEAINNIKDRIDTLSIAEYIDEHSEYYYKIEGSVYCITKQDLIDSNEISESVIEKMEGNIIEAKYINGEFVLEYNPYCEEK
jgi:hypothetical protein